MLNYKRGERKVLADYKTHDIYKFYKAKYGKGALSQTALLNVWKEVYPEIVKRIIFENFEYRMAGRLGSLSIKKKLREVMLDKDGNLNKNQLTINWKKTKKLWEDMYPGKTPEEIKDTPDKPLVRELNEHTDGYRLFWNWNKVTSNVQNQTAYILDMARGYDRMLSAAAKHNNLNFYQCL